MTNAGSDNVSVIRTSDNAVTATVAVGSSPFGVAIGVGAADQLDELAATIDGLSLDKQTENSLLTKLRSAEKSLDKGNTSATCSQLSDLLSQITDFASAGKLTDEQASELTADVSRIQAVLGC